MEKREYKHDYNSYVNLSQEAIALMSEMSKLGKGKEE